ncbi:acetylornithine deacetylase/succinyl-diaminopimelate desuccinylase family protein [soil metagenome]
MARFSDEAAARVLGEIHQKEVVELLQALIQVPSVNPPGDVRLAVDHCQRVLDAEGFRTRIVAIDDIKPNLVAEFGPGDGPVLCFNAHLDVVPPGELAGWKFGPFDGTESDGRIYGRGAGDDKASVTAQVMAAIALARAEVPIRGTIMVTAVADEEIGGPAGTRAVLDYGNIKPDYVIVGEQTMNRVAVGEKGFSGCKIITTGKTAHGALPWEGANAIEGMAEVIVALRRELWPKLKDRTHPYFQPSGATVNLIEGGVKANVVADRCEIYIDRRAIPGEDLEASIAEVREIAERAVQNVQGVTVAIEVPFSVPAIMTAPDSPHASALVEAIKFLDGNPELTGFSMGTDGRHFHGHGFSHVVFGPGDPLTAHIQDEWVGIEEVMDATRILALAALELLGA